MPNGHLTRAQAEAAIREVARENNINVRFTDHVEERFADRGESPGSVCNALCNARVIADPTWNAEYRNWDVDVVGETVDAEVRIHVALDRDPRSGNWVVEPKTIVILREK
jgi:hypothetical protein